VHQAKRREYKIGDAAQSTVDNHLIIYAIVSLRSFISLRI
jgi:hypothetical protein